MLKRLFIVTSFLVLGFICGLYPAMAESISICNGHLYDGYYLAVIKKGDTLRIKGYFQVPKAECGKFEIDGDPKHYFVRITYLMEENNGSRLYQSFPLHDDSKNTAYRDFCIPVVENYEKSIDLPLVSECPDKQDYADDDYRSVSFYALDFPDGDNCVLSDRRDALAMNCQVVKQKESAVTVGLLHEECLYEYDDSIQVHKVQTIIEWNYQAVKTEMKKLHHCLKIRAYGPIDIQGIAKKFVDYCVDQGVNDQKNRYLLQLVLSAGVDAFTGGGDYGALTAATVADYINNVTSKTIDCLTDANQIDRAFGENLRNVFNASVVGESHWIYWEL